MEEDIFYILAFNSTSHSIQAEKMIKESFSILMMPTPRELTNDCGIAIKFKDKNVEEIKDFVHRMKVPCDLYAMSEQKFQGKRKITKIISIEEQRR